MHGQHSPLQQDNKRNEQRDVDSLVYCTLVAQIAPSLDVQANDKHAAEDLKEQLQAYCKVARKRIVDVVLMQTIERHIFKRIGLYFDALIKVDNARLQCLIESEADIAVATTFRIESRSWNVACWNYENIPGLVDKVNSLKHLRLNHVLSVPQVVIVGDQSVGKSSVLEAVTKLSFPRDKGMCTRFATQVSLCRDHTMLEDNLSAHIEGEDEFNLRYKSIVPGQFGSVIKEAVSLLCSTNDISEKVLELNLAGPTQLPLTIVDLPGYINTTLDGQDKTIPATIWAINERYLKDP
ncbi:hypothetical protein BG004_008170 [Podila humilis]|nr:hypothetical protein BG004_008170 [Podila humilis]